jgi:Tfp pilus assembly protein PilV
MALESSNLPQHIAAAEQSQLLQTVLQLQERAQGQVAAAHSAERAKAEAGEEVQSAREVEGAVIQGDRKGARSFDLEKREGGQAPSDEPPPEARPPDPTGLGTQIDVKV